MKKILLGTTALAALYAGAAFAETPKITLGGYIDFQASFTDQDYDTAGTGPTTREVKFAQDTEVRVKVDGKADNGLGYGAYISLLADLNGAADAPYGDSSLNSRKTFIYLDGSWGKVELGSTTGVDGTMKVDASTFARATGGVDGDFYRHIAIPAAVIWSPDLPVNFATGAAGENSNKIAYYSPRWSGFQIGLSYTPDTGDAGTTAGFTGELNAGNAEHVVAGAINYHGQWDKIGFAASLTGEFGDAELPGTQDLAAWALGASISYAGWTFGGSYGDWDDSLQVVNGTDAHFWDLGLAYDFGAFGASLGYLSSENGNNDFQNISLGVDYQLAPGLVPYAEVNIFEIDPATIAIPDNDGVVFLIGTQLTF